MPRYIDADKIAEHKFSYITHDRYVSDGRLKSEEEIYAYRVGYNQAIDDIAQFAPTADVVEKERYDRLLENSIIISEALNRYQTADVVERKKGKWEQKEDPYGFFETIPVCSECGCTTKMRETYAYCPNCGAEMEGEDR